MFRASPIRRAGWAVHGVVLGALPLHCLNPVNAATTAATLFTYYWNAALTKIDGSIFALSTGAEALIP